MANRETGAGRSQVRVPEDVAPEDIPTNSGLVVEQDSGEQLVVSFLLNPSLPVRILVGGFCTAFALAWMGISGFMAWSAVMEAGEGSVMVAVFAGTFFFFGFVPLLVGMAVAFGQARVAVDRQWLSVRYHIGPIGWTQKVEIDSVQDVLLGESAHFETEVAGVQRNPMALRRVKVETDSKSMILTLGSKEEVSRNLCGVVRCQLHRLGYRLVSDA